MLKTTLITLLIILLGCFNPKNSTDNRESYNKDVNINIKVELPLNKTCGYFFKWDETNRKFQNKDSLWTIETRHNFELVVKNQLGILRPILISRSKDGTPIDSLILFDKECFIGVDSDYWPWLEVTNDLQITWLDTVKCISSIKLSDDESTESVVEFSNESLTVNRIRVFQVGKNGQISEVRNTNQH